MSPLRMVFMLGIFGSQVFAQPGALDATFGSGGIVTTDLSAASDNGRDGLVLPDGRIIVCGASDGFLNFIVIRYLPNGTVDSTFGTNGIVTINFGATGTEATGIVRQPDGKLVVAGYFISAGVSFSAVVRLDSTGAPDTQFGSAGRAIHSIGLNGMVQDVLLQPDGKILIAGTIRSGSTLFMGLRRYQATGALDSAFGIDGTVTRGPGTSNSGNAIALQPDSKIVAVGSTTIASATDILTFRFLPNGSPDSSFGTVGRVITSLSVFSDFGGDVAVLPDGKILAAGHTGTAASIADQYGVVRLNINGTPDSTFGNAGIALTPVLGNPNGYAFLSRMLLLLSGKVLLTGQATLLGSSDDFALVRMKANGGMDSTFGTNGIVYTNIAGSGRDIPYRLLHQPDGKIVAVGQGGTGEFSGGPRVTLVRYLHDELPTTVKQTAAVPGGFALDQNYPNPFNPSTKIGFIIQDSGVRGQGSGFTSLKVYDVLGREVATLVDEVMQPGSYEVTFDAPGLASGVYFYTLQAGQFISTRKLLLIK